MRPSERAGLQRELALVMRAADRLGLGVGRLDLADDGCGGQQAADHIADARRLAPLRNEPASGLGGAQLGSRYDAHSVCHVFER